MMQYLIHGIIVFLVIIWIGGPSLNLWESFLIALVATITWIMIDLGLYCFKPHYSGSQTKTQNQYQQNDLPRPLPQPPTLSPSPHQVQNQTHAQIQQQETLPYHFLQISPKIPIPGVPMTETYSLTDTHQSRWCGWPAGTKAPIDPLKDYTLRSLNTHPDEWILSKNYYGGLSLRPGFSEHVKGDDSSHIPWAPRVWKTQNPLDQYQYAYNGQPLNGNLVTTIPENSSQKGGANEIPGSEMQVTGLGMQVPPEFVTSAPNVFNQSKTTIPFESDIPRLTNVVYSGDLIELGSGNLILQRQTNNSQVVLREPLPTIRTNLSKLRFENQVDGQLPRPIRYRDNIHIKHNALVDNINQSRWIKYGERVQSHQEGPMYEVFKVFNQQNPESNDFIKYGDIFYIAAGDQPSNKIFLKLEPDQSLSSESTIGMATPFTINLIRPYQANDLCVCPGETIFP